MALFRRIQKHVVERLSGNLDYYNRRPAWRGLRFWVSGTALIAGAAAIPAYYHYKAPEAFMNPGPISRPHSAIANNCAACHPQTGMVRADSHQAGQILRVEYFVPIDQACGQCHPRYGFHVPNVVPDLTRTAGTGAQTETSSCTSCHREHQTTGKMLPATDQNCAACHGQPDLMAASAKVGHDIPPNFFPDGVPRRSGGLSFFFKPRPREGNTTPFTRFDQGHPEFQIHKEHLTDPDTLQYNHARHERADIPATEFGTRLDCNYCHKADVTGTNFQKITFEKNCVQCHAMAFDPNVPAGNDPNNPGMVIPHGDPSKVRAFLRTLPVQYLEYAARHDGASAPEAQAFMTASIQKLAATYGAPGDSLAQLVPKIERTVFYGRDHVTTGPQALQQRSQGGGGRGQNNRYAVSCEFCHQVSAPVANLTPTITPAVIFDRWLGDGNFNHAKHQQQSCGECHSSIHTSERTSDINIPTQKSCTLCHNNQPKGVANDCQSCHHYHNDPARRTLEQPHDFQPKTAAPTVQGSLLRRIMLSAR